jgi:transcriptional regulator with XRE-family HTH domain
MRRRYDSLADYLERSGETQEQLAERLHISQPTISRAKQFGLGSYRLLKRIADATGVPLESFGQRDAA